MSKDKSFDRVKVQSTLTTLVNKFTRDEIADRTTPVRGGVVNQTFGTVFKMIVRKGLVNEQKLKGYRA